MKESRETVFKGKYEVMSAEAALGLSSGGLPFATAMPCARHCTSAIRGRRNAICACVSDEHTRARPRKATRDLAIMSGRPPDLPFQTVSPLLCNSFPFKKVLQLSFKELSSYDDRQFYFEGELDSESSTEEDVSESDRTRPFVLRFTNLLRTIEHVQGANALMLHLGSKGINCTRPIMSRFGRYLETIPARSLDPKGGSAEVYPMRVFKFLPGLMMNELDDKYLTPEFLYRLGQFAGRVNAALQVRNQQLKGCQ